MATPQKSSTSTSTVRAKGSRPAPVTQKVARQVTQDMVAARAYEIWQRKGCQGSDEENWYEAEQELAATAHDE